MSKDTIEPQIIGQLHSLLGKWCDQYDKTQAPNPRYAQFDLEGINDPHSKIYSTINGYSIAITEDFFNKKQFQWFIDTFVKEDRYIWDWFKHSVRTPYLIERYGTFNPENLIYSI